MALPQFSQGGIVHGGFPLGDQEGGDIHLHSWYDADGNLVEENLTARLSGGVKRHIPLYTQGGTPRPQHSSGQG